jgi:hypothetical protein
MEGFGSTDLSRNRPGLEVSADDVSGDGRGTEEGIEFAMLQ